MDIARGGKEVLRNGGGVGGRAGGVISCRLSRFIRDFGESLA